MDLQEKILAYMKESVFRPLPARELATIVGVDEHDDVFVAALKALEGKGQIIANRSGLYGIPARMNLVVGRLAVSPKGFGFIVPDDRLNETETDVFVLGINMLTAMHGDRVVARVSPSEILGRSREGEILRVLERANTHIVGTFERSQRFGFVTPDSAKINEDIFVDKKYFANAKTGNKVVVEIIKWREKGRSAEGKIVEILGNKGDKGLDVLSIMRQHDLSESFPKAVLSEATKIETLPVASDYEGRRDRRDYPIVTIDGDDTKDIDDGVYAYKMPNGNIFLGVYIADVSHYVREGMALDDEAGKRGTSIYLVDRVIPMLPKELSNGICSLNEGVDRLSMACEMEIDRTGQVVSYEIMPAVIKVYRRLTYKLVNKLLDREEFFVDDNEDIMPMVNILDELRSILKSKRRQRGSIDFDIPEIKVKLDEKGEPIDLIKRVGSKGEAIIEECMLIANETVARHMELKDEPFIYRVHEQPNSEKIERLTALLQVLGVNLRVDDEGKVCSKDIQANLEKFKGLPEERLVSTVALRSMQQARYSTNSLGHFGLAARYYTHFTSPIRRYPDLIVHRLLRETLATGHISGNKRERLRGILPDIAEHSSVRERIAIEVERETTDMKKVEYMAKFVGDVYDGVISGVTQFGIFVELDNGVEGLVHVSTMANDYYTFVEKDFAMIGERTNTRYRLGDSVRVVLVKANIETRTLDFVLEDNGVYDLTSLKNSRTHDIVGSHSKPENEQERKEIRSNKKKSKNKNSGRKGQALIEDSDLIVAQIQEPAKSNADKNNHVKAVKSKVKNNKAQVGAVVDIKGKDLTSSHRSQNGNEQKNSRDNGDRRGKRYEKSSKNKSKEQVNIDLSEITPTKKGNRSSKNKPKPDIKLEDKIKLNIERKVGNKIGKTAKSATIKTETTIVGGYGGYGSVWQDPPPRERKRSNKPKSDKGAKLLGVPKPRPRLQRKTEGGTGRAK